MASGWRPGRLYGALGRLEAKGLVVASGVTGIGRNPLPRLSPAGIRNGDRPVPVDLTAGVFGSRAQLSFNRLGVRTARSWLVLTVTEP